MSSISKINYLFIILCASVVAVLIYGLFIKKDNAESNANQIALTIKPFTQREQQELLKAQAMEERTVNVGPLVTFISAPEAEAKILNLHKPKVLPIIQTQPSDQIAVQISPPPAIIQPTTQATTEKIQSVQSAQTQATPQTTHITTPTTPQPTTSVITETSSSPQPITQATTETQSIPEFTTNAATETQLSPQTTAVPTKPLTTTHRTKIKKRQKQYRLHQTLQALPMPSETQGAR